MKVGTPFGEFPFEYRRVERRPDGIVVIGTVAGLESSVVFDREDARRAGKVLAVAAALAFVGRRLRRRS
ncbi:MAG: hypothetical protein BGO11_18220 [Solirubrobacterales bacterium 70-9]|nr:MAG: hypothetical protein BGO11_18220 [Solirubrobacterales bacterium 70-9]